MEKTPKYVWINTGILDDFVWGILPDSEWLKKFLDYIHNPNKWGIGDGRFFRKYGTTKERIEFICMRPKIKKELFAKDKNVCRHCGTTEHLSIDHIIPLSRGGSNDMDNLQILCRSCNSRKWAK